MKCDRCSASNLKQFYYSWFNSDLLCKQCRASEEADKDYAACRKAEHEAVLKGDYNFSFDANYGKKKTTND